MLRTIYPNEKMKARELQVGDVVEPLHNDFRNLYPNKGPWRTQIVKQIDTSVITLFRPYGTTLNFTYSGGIICLMGIEEYHVSVESQIEFLVYERKEEYDEATKDHDA